MSSGELAALVIDIDRKMRGCFTADLRGDWIVNEALNFAMWEIDNLGQVNKVALTPTFDKMLYKGKSF